MKLHFLSKVGVSDVGKEGSEKVMSQIMFSKWKSGLEKKHLHLTFSGCLNFKITAEIKILTKVVLGRQWVVHD